MQLIALTPKHAIIQSQYNPITPQEKVKHKKVGCFM